MSDTTQYTNYVFGLRVGMTSIAFTYTSGGEMTDEMAIKFAHAFKELGWEPGLDVAAQVQRQDFTVVQSYEDDSTTPPAFT